MLDTARFDIPLLNADTYVNSYLARNPKCKGRKWYSAVIRGAHGNGAFIRPVRNNTWLRVEVCIPKFLDGHNVFAPSRIRRQVKLVVQRIAEALEVPPQVDRIMAAAYFLRVDLVVNLKLTRGTSTHQWLRALHSTMDAEGRALQGFNCNGKVNTVHLRSSERRLVRKWYDKKVELRSRPIPSDVPGRERIEHWAGRVVRFEVSLRGALLGDKRVATWSARRARGVLNRILDGIKLRATGIVQSLPKCLKTLTPRLAAIVKVHARGIRPQEIFERRTVHRAQGEILKRSGYDIYADPRRKPVAVRQLLEDESRRFFGRPRWARHLSNEMTAVEAVERKAPQELL